MQLARGACEPEPGRRGHSGELRSCTDWLTALGTACPWAAGATLGRQRVGLPLLGACGPCHPAATLGVGHQASTLIPPSLSLLELLGSAKKVNVNFQDTDG